jgi:hypothetical protein
MTMERKLLLQEQNLIDLAAANVYYFENQVNEVISEFNELNLDLELDYDLLWKLIHDPDKLVSDYYKDKLPDTDSHTGLPVNKNAAFATLELPSTKVLKQKCQVLSGQIAEFLPLCGVTESRAEVDMDLLNGYLDKFRLYSDDPAVLKLYRQLLQIGKILTAVNAEVPFIQSTNSVINYDIGQLYKFDPDKEIVLSMKGFKELMQKL